MKTESAGISPGGVRCLIVLIVTTIIKYITGAEPASIDGDWENEKMKRSDV
jgi:hypothetical protein